MSQKNYRADRCGESDELFEKMAERHAKYMENVKPQPAEDVEQSDGHYQYSLPLEKPRKV